MRRQDENRLGRQVDYLDIGSLDLTARGDVDRGFCQENVNILAGFSRYS